MSDEQGPVPIKLPDIVVEGFLAGIDADQPVVSIKLPGCPELRMHNLQAMQWAMKVFSVAFAIGQGREGKPNLSGDFTHDVASIGAAMMLVAEQRRAAGL